MLDVKELVEFHYGTCYFVLRSAVGCFDARNIFRAQEKGRGEDGEGASSVKLLLQ